MARSNALALAAGGMVVVALSFGAGMLGGSTAATSPSGTAPAPRSVPDSVVRSRLDELDRRLGNVEERLRVAEDTANAALTRAHEIDALRRAIDELRGGAVPAPVEAPRESDTTGGDEGPPQPLTPEQRDAREAEQIAKLRRQADEIVARQAPALLTQRLHRIADATAQGAADRRSQLYAETKQLAVLYSMTPREEDVVREILTEEAESAVRDVAPYLGGGLERADFSAVKGKLFAIWDRRDARMAEVLDQQELEDYTDRQKKWREVYAKVLDDLDAARLNR